MVENELNIKLIELDELKLIGIRVVCPGDEYVNEIPKAFDQMRKRVGEITHLKSGRFIGVYKPGDFSEEEDGYWVCVEVEDNTIVPQGMVHLTVPPQRYTMINHRGPVADIFKTYEESHKMMSAGGYKRLLRAWHLEIYETNRSVVSNEVDVDLYNVIE
jgi:predicted transcriptional regulator YdeE